MIRRTLAAGLTAALVLPLGPVANAADEPRPELVQEVATATSSAEKGPVLSLGTGKARELYVVQLADPAVPARESALSEDGRSLQKSPDAERYEDGLVAEQTTLRSSIKRITGSTPQVRFTYTRALNGIAVKLSRAEALRVSRLDGVSAVTVDKKRQMMIDVGPEWIGATGIWDGSQVPGGTGNKGEGVVVGILDSGINPANPSFAASVPTADGGDGYAHTNPLGDGTYKGMCDPANADIYVASWGCNDKLIGYWNFTGDGSAYDDDGHGTHTASTTAGNQVEVTTYAAKGTPNEFSTTETIKGVAPHANIIAYDVCEGGCSVAAITAAIEQSIDDGVDAINYSIGSSAPSAPWSDPDALGFLNARAAGIHVATSAGNAGPGAGTVGSPADVPWITSVGASQHDRQWQAKVQELTADGGATLPNITGVAFAKASDGAFPLVNAGTLGSARCIAAELGNTDLSDKIVVCDRGGTGRVEKGEVVAALGAKGMVLANDEASGSSLNADAHVLPAVHITYSAGVALKAWMASVTNPKASLSGGLRHIGNDVADIMAGFSSRGPNRSSSLISPSVSAPGVDILAGLGTDNELEWGFESGTSMASPHTAGALALLKGVQPDWSPAEAQSALMTTAERAIKDTDGSEADWFDMGSGRVELRRAAKAGVVFDENETRYLAADPLKGGDVRGLNLASMADNECLESCSWTRTLTGTSTGVGAWQVSVENVSPGVTLSVDKSSVSLTDGGNAEVTVTANVAPNASTSAWLFGTLALTPPSGSTAPEAHLPVAVLPSAGVIPTKVDITTRRDAGSQVEKGLQAIAISDLQAMPSGLVPETRKAISVVQDTTNDDPFDGNGVHVERVTVPAGAQRLVAKLENATAPDYDMYVGRGAVSEENLECTSASGGSAESCDLADPAAGDWWVLVQNWQATSPSAPDTADLVTAVVAGNAGNLRATGPSGALPAATPFDLRVFYDEPAMEAGQTWYGALTLGTAPGKAGNIGVVPVDLHRVAADVTKSADVETAAPGDVITYTVEVQPNVTREDLGYTISDTLPAGTTYMEGSATGGATYANGAVSWSGTLPTSYGKEGTYDITSSKTDSACINPFSEDVSYTDLYAETDGAIKSQPSILGDTKAFTGFSSSKFGFYGEQYSGLSFTDDGFLYYGDNYAGTPWEPQMVPDVAEPNNVAAPLWQDMEIVYDAATNKGVSLASAGDLKVIEYDDIQVYGEPTQTYDMEVFATEGSNDLVFAYDNISGPLSEVTIGTENAAGTAGTALVNKGNATLAVTNGTVVCAAFESPEADPVELTYQVSVDGSVHERQALVNKAVHTVDNPGARPATASTTVRVKGAKERSGVSVSVNPNRFDVGATTTATATVFSAGEDVPTGQVQFLVGDRVAATVVIGVDGRAMATLGGFTTAGAFPVVAKYLGDATTLPSTSAPVNVAVMAPDQPMPKVKPAITIKAPNKVKVGKRANMKIIVTAPRVTPSGKVKVVLRGAGKKKTIVATLNARGMAKVKLPRYHKTGKVKVKVKYLGDAAVRKATKKTKIRVVRRGR